MVSINKRMVSDRLSIHERLVKLVPSFDLAAWPHCPPDFLTGIACGDIYLLAPRYQ